MTEKETTQPKPYKSEEEKKEEVKVEKKEEVKDIENTDETLPVFLKRLPNENLVCSTKDGDFEFEDMPYKKVISAKKRATRRQADGTELTDMDNFEMILISESLVNPKMPEMELKELRASTVMKLRATVYKLYDIASFLSM